MVEITGKERDLCGYDNLHALVVHHIDEDRSNNTIDNLIVLCANCHAEVHEGNYSKKHIK
jgi:predicted HNH restriction endonuclease